MQLGRIFAWHVIQAEPRTAKAGSNSAMAALVFGFVLSARDNPVLWTKKLKSMVEASTNKGRRPLNPSDLGIGLSGPFQSE
jgi:hypothetical protein